MLRTKSIGRRNSRDSQVDPISEMVSLDNKERRAAKALTSLLDLFLPTRSKQGLREFLTSVKPCKTVKC